MKKARLCIGIVLGLGLTIPTARAGDQPGRENEAHQEGRGKGDKDDHDKREKADRDKGERDMDRGRHHEESDEHRRDGGRHDEESEDEDDNDAVPMPDIHRTPAATDFRDKLVAHERQQMSEFAHKIHRKFTQDERHEMAAHWRRVMRLERIRQLAAEEKDQAIVGRVDALLDREKQKFAARLGTEGSGAEGGAK